MRTNLNIRLIILLVALFLGTAPFRAFAQSIVGVCGLDDGLVRVTQQPAFYLEFVDTTIEGDKISVIKGIHAKNGAKERLDIDMRGTPDAAKANSCGMGFLLYTGTIIKPTSSAITLLHIPHKFMLGEGIQGEENTDLKDVSDANTQQEEEKPIVDKIEVGEEKIDGHPCSIYSITVTYKDDRKVTGKIWEANDYGDLKPYLKVILDQPNGQKVYELHNLKIGEPDEGWFEIPEGYAGIADVMELMR